MRSFRVPHQQCLFNRVREIFDGPARLVRNSTVKYFIYFPTARPCDVFVINSVLSAAFHKSEWIFSSLHGFFLDFHGSTFVQLTLLASVHPPSNLEMALVYLQTMKRRKLCSDVHPLNRSSLWFFCPFTVSITALPSSPWNHVCCFGLSLIISSFSLRRAYFESLQMSLVQLPKFCLVLGL